MRGEHPNTISSSTLLALHVEASLDVAAGRSIVVDNARRASRRIMHTSFLHLSDIHLGYQQYGHRERFNDFGRAFLSAVRYAVENQVGFVLISGD